MEALPSPSNLSPTNVACSSPIPTNPNPTTVTTPPDPLAAPKSPMAESSSPTVAAEAGANKENICPVTNLAASSRVSRKRRRFSRKPLADITNEFKQRNSSSEGLLGSSGAPGQKTLKRKAGLGGCDGGEVKRSSRSKTLRMSFR
uniref:Uncharacterized protein n=1 Tax=Kalanchoe fedtschenkoi TaxID=63787 RepID=A0A7N0VL56_KALFE